MEKVSYIFKGPVANVYIIRHPEVENYKDRVFNGSVDVGLSSRGYRQARVLAEFFKLKNIKRVFSSPLKRCAVVAEYLKQISNDAEIFYDDRLKERNFGVFESKSWGQIEHDFPKEAEQFLNNPFNYRVRGGESFEDVYLRVAQFLQDAVKDIKNDMLIIAHGGVNRAFITHFLQMNSNAILKISQDYACINHFQTDGDFVLAKLINGQVA